MDAFEVTFDELDACALQLTDCANDIRAAATLLQGVAPDTGRSDTTTMASNAANALNQDLTDAGATLDGVIEQLGATARAYRAADGDVAARLGAGEPQ